MTGGSQTFRSAVEEAELCSQELHAAASAAIFEAVRARAIADLAQERDTCHQQVAAQRAALCVEIAAARAALNVDRLRHDAVAVLEKEIASLKQDLVDLRACLAVKTKRCEDLESVIANRGNNPDVMDSAASLERRAQVWRCVLRFSDEADLRTIAAVCAGLRIEAEKDGLWELLCRNQFSLDELQHCTNFHSALISRSCNARWQESREELARLQAAMVRTLSWTVPIGKKRKQNSSTVSPYFSLLGLRDSYILFYPKGDSAASPGHCSLYIHTPQGIELEVAIKLNGQHTRTMKRAANKDELRGYSSLAPAVGPGKVEIILEFAMIRKVGRDLVFDVHDESI